MKIVRTMHVLRIEAELAWKKAGATWPPQDSPIVVSRTAVLVDSNENELKVPLDDESPILAGDKWKITIEPAVDGDAPGCVGRLKLLDVVQTGDNEGTAVFEVDLLEKLGSPRIIMAVGDVVGVMSPTSAVRFEQAKA